MSSGKRPGHECASKDGQRLDDGTLCRQPSPRPGPLGVDWPDGFMSELSHARDVAGHWADAAGSWLDEAQGAVAGQAKSLLLTLIDLLPFKQSSPFSTALLRHYVERSGAVYELGDIPSDWQDWIVAATGGRLGMHRALNPYNSGLFDLRNSLGHFDVEVKAEAGGKKRYVLSDVYQFDFIPHDTLQRGRHGFPIGQPAAWQLAAARRLLPTREYQNPGGFKERWEIRGGARETVILIPQEFLAGQGKAFAVHGEFVR